MIVFAAVVGLFAGTFLDWAGVYLYRFNSSRVLPPPESIMLPTPAWWRGIVYRKWDWPGIAVELLTTSLFVFFWTRYGPSWRLLELVFYLSIFQIITLTDLRYGLILNVVVYPSILFVLLIHLLSARLGVLSALLGGVVGLAFFLIVMLVRRGTLGAGDVKLAALIGVVVGFPQVLWALALGILAGGVGALFVLATGRGGLQSYIPYGPFLCVGAMLALLYPPFPFPIV